MEGLLIVWVVLITYLDDGKYSTRDFRVFNSKNEAQDFFRQICGEVAGEMHKNVGASVELDEVNMKTQNYDILWEAHFNVYINE